MVKHIIHVNRSHIAKNAKDGANRPVYMTDFENLKGQISIRSECLSPMDCYNGTNKAYWSIKYAYHALGLMQEELRAEKNYGLADQIREVRAKLHDGYTYRIHNDIDQLKGGSDG